MADSSVSQAAPQPANVASVFGEPYGAGDKVLIPVAQVAIAATPKGEKRARKQVAIIEVSGGKVRIKSVRSIQALAFGVMLVGAWYLYWIQKTVREWRAKH
ncbi:MAG TPA: hypothetical protein VEX13_12085 [Chloroflexia bacterium]|nr:hypothetical protein [Chloroflexia bacterium]